MGQREAKCPQGHIGTQAQLSGFHIQSRTARGTVSEWRLWTGQKHRASDLKQDSGAEQERNEVGMPIGQCPEERSQEPIKVRRKANWTQEGHPRPD